MVLVSPQLASLPEFHVSSDATGALGYSTILVNQFASEWSSVQKPLPVAYKELFPVVVAFHLWGHHWAAKRMKFSSDNMAVGSVLCSGTSKDPNMMVLLRSLSLSAACHSFAFTASHRAGRDNCTANTLSHFDFQRFSSSRTKCGTGCNPNPTIATGPASRNLTAKYHFYLANGLAPSTHQVYMAQLNTSSSNFVARTRPLIGISCSYPLMNKL